MPAVSPQATEYSRDELVNILVNRVWERAFVVYVQKGGRYACRLDKPGSPTFSVPYTEMTKAQIWVCSQCGNWFDPDKLPSFESVSGSKCPISIHIDPACKHNGLPYHMRLRSWEEVPGVTAIGGIHAI